jgi:hypothetical protein
VPACRRQAFVATSSVSRPRTSVLNLLIPLRHRFFFKLRAHSLHDRALPSPNPPSPRASMVHFFRRAFSRIHLDSPRGHTRRNALRFRRRLLLQMRSFQNEIRLHENVRIAPLRLALVGHHLRQAPRVFPNRQSRRWPAPPSSRPRRTREQLESPSNHSLARAIVSCSALSSQRCPCAGPPATSE